MDGGCSGRSPGPAEPRASASLAIICRAEDLLLGRKLHQEIAFGGVCPAPVPQRSAPLSCPPGGQTCPGARDGNGAVLLSGWHFAPLLSPCSRPPSFARKAFPITISKTGLRMGGGVWGMTEPLARGMLALCVPAVILSWSTGSIFLGSCQLLQPCACRSAGEGRSAEHTSHTRCVSEVLCLVYPLPKELLW